MAWNEYSRSNPARCCHVRQRNGTRRVEIRRRDWLQNGVWFGSKPAPRLPSYCQISSSFGTSRSGRKTSPACFPLAISAPIRTGTRGVPIEASTSPRLSPTISAKRSPVPRAKVFVLVRKRRSSRQLKVPGCYVKPDARALIDSWLATGDALARVASRRGAKREPSLQRTAMTLQVGRTPTIMDMG